MKLISRASLCTGSMFLIFASSQLSAAQWDVTVTNLTHGNHFTPLLLTAHDHDTHIFQVGEAASIPMEHMAECGHLAALLETAEVGPVDDDTITDPAGGVLSPGTSTTAMIMTNDAMKSHLSIVAMILPTNDGFVGMDSQHIPAEAGTYTYYLNGYDAGTEGNDETINPNGPESCTYTEIGMIPIAPGGDADTGGTGVVTPGDPDTNPNIHIHRGILGEADATTGGRSDLINSIHRWQNPVAKVVVTVTP
jgi:hypothetical protein